MGLSALAGTTVRGGWLLEDFGFEFVRTGDSADQFLTFFADVGKELALT